MNIFKQIIPVAIVAVPMLGMASGSVPAISAHQATTALADSDSVSVGICYRIYRHASFHYSGNHNDIQIPDGDLYTYG